MKEFKQKMKALLAIVIAGMIGLVISLIVLGITAFIKKYF